MGVMKSWYRDEDDIFGPKIRVTLLVSIQSDMPNEPETPRSYKISGVHFWRERSSSPKGGGYTLLGGVPRIVENLIFGRGLAYSQKKIPPSKGRLYPPCGGRKTLLLGVLNPPQVVL